MIHVSVHILLHKLDSFHHCRNLIALLLHFDLVLALVLVEQLSHLSVLIGQVLQTQNLCGVLLLERAHFDLHVLDAEVLQVEDLLELPGQIGILLHEDGEGGAARTVSID